MEERLTFRIDQGPRAGEELVVSDKRIIVGSGPDCDFLLNDPAVSPDHASFKIVDGGVEVRDLGSRAGTFVNGRRIEGAATVAPGDRVGIGSTAFELLGSSPSIAAPVGTMSEPQPVIESPVPAASVPAMASSPPAGSKKGNKGLIAGVVGTIVVAGIVVAVLAALGVFSSKKLTAAQVASLDKSSTVMVVSRVDPTAPMAQLIGTGGDILGSGSGWVYDAAQGLIVTNAHVVVSGTSAQVGYDKASLTSATILAVDLPDDIAVLKIAPGALPGLRTLSRALPSSIHEGDTTYVLGFPSNNGVDFLKTPFQFTNGVVSATSASGPVSTDEIFGNDDNASVLYSDLYQTSAAINAGNSGGPMVNDQGQLVGMNVASTSNQNQGLAIPVLKINSVIGQLARGSSIGWPGFGADAIPSSLAQKAGISGGLILTAVAKDTPADQDGLLNLGSVTQGGGLLVITKVNDQSVTTAQEYYDALKNIASGETMKLTFVGLDPTNDSLLNFRNSSETWVGTKKIAMP
ncbi:MAG: trypsin-like peptidase domain-containing protein [Actinomycetota bacterium]